jgi:dipeptidase E
MRYYLSSYRVGAHGEKLAELCGGGPLALIPNSLDHIPVEQLVVSPKRNREDLVAAGVSFETFDLREFFSSPDRIGAELEKFKGVWITGGNTFVLRQAMRLSGFDRAINEVKDKDFLYGGFSAGICVLAPNLLGLSIVDDPNIQPYRQSRETIWEGLGLLDYLFLPHYQSDHPESADIEKEVDYCTKKGIAFRTIRDGEAVYGTDLSEIKSLT